MDGYVNVLKPPGRTSHDVVGLLRRLTGERRIGHAGTLDPAAIGVLPVAIGRRATRTVSSTIWDQKTYWAEIELGRSTTTDDAEGDTLASGDASGVTRAEIAVALTGFVGELSQRPPAYSAVHIDGQRSYHSARQGAPRELPSRTVQVDAIRLLDWAPPLLQIGLQCHSGTYIRSIARDLGSQIGCPAHLRRLVRTRVGPFGIDTSLDPATLEAVFRAGGGDRTIWPIDVVALHLPAVAVSPSHAVDVDHGRGWAVEGVGLEAPHDTVRIFDSEGDFLGFASAADGQWELARAPA
jgi:tRNA pseudouridine55 synthase